MIQRRGFAQLLLLFVVLFTMARSCGADGVGYAARRTVELRNDRYSVVHFHDWSEQTRETRFTLIGKLNHYESYFSSASNTFAYVKVYDRSTGNLVFRSPTPALTHLWVSPDSRYLVGLSNVKLWNPYQLIVFSLPDGKLVYKEHIASEVCTFTPEQLNQFFQQYPKAKIYLQQRTKQIGQMMYVDAYTIDMPTVVEKAAFDVLFYHRVPNPYSPNFRESVTNWMDWFDKKRPVVELQNENSGLVLTLRDPKGGPFRVPLGKQGD